MTRADRRPAPNPARTALRAAFALACAGAIALVLAACAVVEPPLGGPEDLIPPHLAATTPDSAATGLGPGVTTFELVFSEKMDRQPAISWLHFFPDQRIRKTSWHGAVRAEVVLESPLPADTVVVVEIAGGMKDAHKKANRHSRRFPVATGDSIPGGRISGVLVMADSAVSNGVLELYDVPPDSVEYFRQPLLRRTVTDRTGAYTFDWLPVPGGPWLVRAFVDADGDLRPGEREARRLLPDTLSLDADRTRALAGVVTLYPPTAPGRLRVGPFAAHAPGSPTVAWTMRVTDEDTGWTAAPVDRGNFAVLVPDSGGVVADVDPGLNRMVVFADLDADSLFGVVPAALVGVPVDSAALAAGDSVVTHYLEPWLLVEALTVEPGLATAVALPELPYSLTPWTAPPALPDSAGAAADSLAAAADSTATVRPQE